MHTLVGAAKEGEPTRRLIYHRLCRDVHRLPCLRLDNFLQSPGCLLRAVTLDSGPVDASPQDISLGREHIFGDRAREAFKGYG